MNNNTIEMPLSTCFHNLRSNWHTRARTGCDTFLKGLRHTRQLYSLEI
jgi:hypothetical protein